MTLTLSILTGCKNVSEEAISATPADSEMETRGVQNWSLWEPLDYFNTGVFNKANWTNGQGLRIIYFYRLFQGILRVYRKAFAFQK